MRTTIEISEADLRRLIFNEIQRKLGDITKLDEKDVRIEVKSKQNYRSEWESAAFRARYEGEI